MTSIISNISKHITLSQDEVDYFLSLLKEKRLSKKETLLSEGGACLAINYIQGGALRAFYRDKDDDENIIMFAIADWWITDMYAFSEGKPAMLNIDALEDSVIYQLDRSDLEKLYIQIPAFERFFRIIMQKAYVREQLRVIENLSMPAQDRYNNFLKKYPQFAQRMPLKQIASYLGITPEFLSVLRKKASQGIS